MSDERPRYGTMRFPYAGILGKKILFVELFQAKHWRLRHGMSVFPSIQDKPSVGWDKMYRIRIDGCWFGKRKYNFFSLFQVSMVVEKILEKRALECGQIIEIEPQKEVRRLPEIKP